MLAPSHSTRARGLLRVPVRPFPLFLLLASACSGPRATPAPTPPASTGEPATQPASHATEPQAPPTPTALPEPVTPTPVELSFGDGAARHSLVVSFRTQNASSFVESIHLDDATVFPTDCTLKTDLCLEAHRELRGETTYRAGAPDDYGKGRDVRLETYEAQDDRVYALFASTTHGSPECGVYAYWVLRADARGARVTPPVRGCFVSVHDDDSTLVSPHVTWTSPPLLWLETPLYGPDPRVTVFALDDATMTLTKKAESRSTPGR